MSQPVEPALLPPAKPSGASSLRVAAFTLMGLFVAFLVLLSAVQPERRKLAAWSDLNARQGRFQLDLFYFLKGQERIGQSLFLAGFEKSADNLAKQALEQYNKALADPKAPARY